MYIILIYYLKIPPSFLRSVRLSNVLILYVCNWGSWFTLNQKEGWINTNFKRRTGKTEKKEHSRT